MDNLQILKWRLAETIAWCNLRLNPDDPENSLRSPELDFKVQPYDEKGHFNLTEAEWLKAVDKLASRRAELLQTENSYPVAPTQKLKNGRILLYYPDDTLYMGATTNESYGFFDLNDSPAWDTWVSILTTDKPERYFSPVVIICWVPAEFESYADSGIRVSPEACICWSNKLMDFHLSELKQADLWNILDEFLTQIS